MRKKFVIVSPRQYGGGPIVLHALCTFLCDLGYDARVFYGRGLDARPGRYWRCFFEWLLDTLKDSIKIAIVKCGIESHFAKYSFTGYGDSESVKGCRRKYLPFVDKDTVVVYPEMCRGDFLKSKNVVRWLLYHPWYLKAVEDSYKPSDLFVAYREVFNDVELNPECHILQTPYFDLGFYKKTNFSAREGTCYVLRKGKWRADLPKAFDGPIIDKLSENEKVSVFNECEYCISYDTQTAYSSIAAMCGCVSIVVPEPGKGREDYLSVGEQGYGVAYGFSEHEIKYAKETASLVYEKYRNANETSIESARSFVDLCEEYFE